MSAIPHIQQGDVLLHFIDESDIPNGLSEYKPVNGRIVLQEGEFTGHAHAIHDTAGVSVLEQGEGENRVLYLKVGDKPVSVTHEEHNPVILPPNTVLKLGIVQEYLWHKKQAARVAD